MPTILSADDLATISQNGAAQTMLAHPPVVGATSLHVERLILDPGAQATVTAGHAAECFLHVNRQLAFSRKQAERIEVGAWRP